MSNAERKKKIFITIIQFIISFCVISMIITHVVMNNQFARKDNSAELSKMRYEQYENELSRISVDFKSDKNTLKGYVYGNDNEKGLIVISHGMGAGHISYINEIAWFVKNGWCVFAYDGTGYGESEGESTIGLSQAVLDLENALTYIENDNNLSKYDLFLYGHSLGGFANTAVLNFEHHIKACVSVAGFADTNEKLLDEAKNMMSFFAYVEYPFIWLDNKFRFGEYSSFSAIEGINKSDVPVLIICGNDDDFYNDVGIIAKESEITNPNAEFLTISDEGANGHNSIFCTKDYNEKLAELDEEYDDIDTSDFNELKSIYNKIDRTKADGLNIRLFEQINSFYEKYL